MVSFCALCPTFVARLHPFHAPGPSRPIPCCSVPGKVAPVDFTKSLRVIRDKSLLLTPHSPSAHGGTLFSPLQDKEVRG